MKTHRVFIPKLEEAERSRYYLRLSMEMLIDARYNPFTDANDGNEKGNYNDMKDKFNFVTVPATVTLYNEDGNALMHYSNAAVMGHTDIKPPCIGLLENGKMALPPIKAVYWSGTTLRIDIFRREFLAGKRIVTV